MPFVPFRWLAQPAFGLLLRFALSLVCLAPTVSAAPPARRSPAKTLIISKKQAESAVERQSDLLGATSKFQSDPVKSPVPLVAAQNQLSRLSIILSLSNDPVDQIERLIAEGATGRDVSPSKLEVVLDAIDVKIEKSATETSSDEGQVDRESLAAGLSKLHRALGSLGRRREVQLDVFEWDAPAENALTTTAWFRASASSVVRRARWTIEWSLDAEERPRIRDITSTDFVQTTSKHRLFEARTSGQIGALPAWRQVSEFDGNGVARTSVQQTGHNLSGLTVGDVNGDGLDDLFVPQPGEIPNLMFVRQADGTLKEMAQDLGLDWVDATSAALLADFDNDGDQDFAIITEEGLFVLENEGDRFEIKKEFDIHSGSLAAADYNGDGLIDLLVHSAATTTPVGKIKHPVDLEPAVAVGRLRLYRNDDDFAFSDTTLDSGLGGDGALKRYAATWEDLDDDGDPDLLLAQRDGSIDWYPNEAGQFQTPIKIDRDGTAPTAAMACGDINRDGMSDCVIGNGWPDMIREIFSSDGPKGESSPSLGDISATGSGNSIMMGTDDAGLVPTGNVSTGWTNGLQLADLDNSGSLDLIALNGFVSSAGDLVLPESEGFDRLATAKDADRGVGEDLLALLNHRLKTEVGKERPSELGEVAIMLREGRSLAGHQRHQVLLNTLQESDMFADVSSGSGLDMLADGRGLALVDWDQDGDLDVWITNRNSPTLQFFENVRGSEAGTFIELELVGTESNRDAVGARVTVELEDGTRLRRTVRAGEAYRSQSSRRVHVGLGAEATIKSVVVLWPVPGVEQTFEGLSPNQFYRLTEGTAEAETIDVAPLPIQDAPEQVAIDQRGAEGILLRARPLFPRVRYLTSGTAQTRRVSWKPGKPLLLVLWDPKCEVCRDEMRQLKKLRGLDCLALAPLGPVKQRRLPADVARKQGFLDADIDESKGFHKVGFIEDELLDEMLTVHRHLFEKPYQLKAPCSFLVDRDGRLAAVYRGQVELKTVIQHFTKLKRKGDALVKETLPLDGKYAVNPPSLFPAGLIADYLLAGNPAAAERLMLAGDFTDSTVPDLLSIKSLLGEMYLVYEDYDKAQEMLSEYLEVYPDSIVALNNLAVLQSKQGENNEAEKTWQRVCELDPKYESAWTNYGTHLLQNERYEDARPITVHLLEISPDSIHAHNLMSIIFLNTREFKKAETHLRKIIELEPRAFGAYANLAKALAVQNDAAGAREVIRAGLAVEGIDDKSKQGLGLLLEHL